MFTAKIENANGQVLTLSQNESDYQIISITGLNPPPAQINTTSIAGLDGGKFNSSKLDTRNIVITLKLNGDVESNRINLYRMFRTKEQCTFYYSNNTRNVSIVGYVETVEVDLFSNAETMQVSIICPSPYFRGMDEIITDISNTMAAFQFPFSINIGSPIPFSIYMDERSTNIFNDSESETGMIIEINVLSAINTILIQDADKDESITLNYAFLDGDKITINTNKGSKSISLLRGGTTYNIFSALAQGSTFFQLAIGDNHFSYSVDDGVNDENVSIKITYSAAYRGV